MKKTTVCNDAIPLPVPVNPHKTICVQLEIPNSIGHIAAFMGALHNLGVNKSWERDVGHNAIEVSRLWKQAYETVRFGCDTKPDVVYAGMEDDMPFFREVCENDKCYLEYQCCPGEWVRLANADQLTQPTSLGEHQEQPPSGGGTAKYCVNMLATGKTILPTLVNTGDVLTLNSASGNANDGTEANFRCPDGNIYYGGACSPGTGYLQAGDPIAHDHMSVILSIAGTFYAFTSGSFTVPGGITNGQVLLQVNDANLTDNSGSYDVCVTVTNNQATTWTKTLSFNLSQEGFLPCLAGGVNPVSNWVIGAGWEEMQNVGGAGNTDNRIFRTLVGITITSVIVSGTATVGQTIYISDGSSSAGITTLLQTGTTPGGAFSLAWSGSQLLAHGLRLDVFQLGTITATSVMVTVVVSGTGANPF